MPSPTLQLLDWSLPLLRSAVLHLSSGWDGVRPLDLGDQLLIVPTRRAGRRLREALAAHAASRGQAVFPPRVCLPEQLLNEAITPGTTATTVHMLVAWIEVLRGARLDDFDAVFPVRPPDQGFTWAARLARQLLHLQDVLIENGLRIADVPDRAGAFPELRRWHQLAELERRLDERLAAAGLRGLHAARLAAVGAASPPEGVRRIVLVATPDPMPLVVRRLAVLSACVPIEVLVHGPSAAAFDSWGKPAQEFWIHRPLALAPFDAHVHPCADPSAQADLIVAMAREHAPGKSGADAMLGISVADPEILAPLHHGLKRAGLIGYDPEGVPHRCGELHRLLELLLALVEDPSFEHACALLRCPVVLEWLGHDQGDAFSAAHLLEALDALRSTHLPVTIADARMHALRQHRRERDVSWEPAARALDAVERVLMLAAGPFPDGVQAALAAIHAHRRLHVAKAEDAAAIAAGENWTGIAHATADAAARLGRVSPRDIWRLALQQFGDTPRFQEKPPGAIELQGWLELPWEDAPHLVVAGFNEGRVPGSIVGDAFLPEALRERLGLRTNTSRLARDAYLLHTLVASRSQHGRIDILLGRTAAAGDPLRPSRLLLVCRESELPARVEFLFREIPPKTGDDAAPAWRRAWRLTPPAPEPIGAISVTAFRDHLACPFRFYLRQKLGMRAFDPRKEELDALDFGNLVHHALEGLHGETDLLRCTDTGKIRALLIDRLDRRARALYGTQLPVPLIVQLESARQRLAHAARVHAEEASRGWVIDAVERKFTCTIGEITVTGRIDRIDRNERTGEVRVLDYKTYEQLKTPESTHTRKPRANDAALPEYVRFTSPDGEELIWTDLQLPLYRRALAPEFGSAITLGYFILPKAALDTAIRVWEGFDSAWQASADRCAEGVAAAIHDGVFWPPTEMVALGDDFEPLFQQGVAASVLWSANPKSGCMP